MIEWPPSHHIRRSRRARHISLTLTPTHGLEIVLPLRATVEEGLNFLDTKRSWIEKHLPCITERVEIEKFFPTEVRLTALNRVWSIRYHHIQTSKKIILRDINQRLIFTGPMQAFKACLPAFNQWLRRLAREHLPQWLSQTSQEIQLTYAQVSIRSQKTLWGSCNRQKDISLNDRLLFLPYELVRYVFIHELCHTVYFGHGKRFWQLVGRFDPNYKTHERNLHDVSFYIPLCFCN